MNRKTLLRTGLAIVACALVAAPSALAAVSPQRAAAIRGQALDRHYGNAWTQSSPAEFRRLVSKLGTDVTSTMTLQQARAYLARSEALNRLGRTYLRNAEPATTVATGGFHWGDAGIGVAATFAALLAATGGAFALRRRGRVALHL